jgi:sulfoxide reductase heme-binding subunit YedZ
MKERLLKHYLPLIVLVLAAVFIFYLNKANRDIITFVAQATGFISITVLSISLIIGPLNLLLKRKNPVSTYFRRDISMAGGFLALIHSITGLFVHLRGKAWLYFLNKTELGYSVRLDNFGLANYAGLISFIIILLLLITSNDLLLKKLNPRKWKNIQRLSYFMFILSLIHCYFYRIGKANLNVFYWFYLPLLITVLVFQILGFRLTLKRNADITSNVIIIVKRFG